MGLSRIRWGLVPLAALAAMFSTSAIAAVIEVEVSLDDLTNTGELQFWVTNDTLASPIEEFTIYLPESTLSNLQVSASPADWDSLVVPAGILPGFFDSLAQVEGIAPGETLTGFAYTFDYVIGNEPGPVMPFEIVDPLTFTVIESGTTIERASVIPLPPALVLFASACALLAGLRRRA